MYFGIRTKTAVIAFQLKYKNEISAVTGYTIKGTGYVGPGTRAKINELLADLRAGIAPGEEEEEEEEELGYCGDGIVQSPNNEGIDEVCDITNLNNQTCQSRGYSGGTLSCSNTCLTFNVSTCLLGGGGSPSPGGGSPAPEPEPEPEPACGVADNICPSGCTYSQDTDCTYCGDNIVQSPNNEGITEVCDTTSLNNQTCITKGFPGGALSCSNDCLTFNTVNCTPPPPPNEAPELTLISDKPVNENEELTFTVTATDPDEDTLTYSVQNLPSGATFQDQTFSWTPNYNQSGTYTLTFTVSDDKLTDSEDIIITVYNINRAPILTSIGNQSINENQTLTFQVSATDPDNDTLTYSIQGLVSGVTFQSKTFTWTPSYEQSGSYNFTFIVSDKELTDTKTITITVNNICASTTCSGLGYECGTWDDGCGGALNCGTCQSSYNCESGQCVEETPEPFCGDGTCNGTETCSTCPQDCGTCPAGNTYYLNAVNGDDENPGTSAQPWKTIDRAYTWYSGSGPKVQEGDTVLFRDGDYGEFLDSSRTANIPHYRTDWVTYKADAGHTPILSNILIYNKDLWNVSGDGFIDGDSWISLEGFNITNGVKIEYTTHVNIINCSLSYPLLDYNGFWGPYVNPSSLMKVTNTDYVIVEGCEMYNAGMGIDLDETGEEIIIRNNEFHKMGKRAIDATGYDHQVIENNYMYDIHKYYAPVDFEGTNTSAFIIGENITQAGTGARGIVYDNNPSGSTDLQAFLTTAIEFEDEVNGGGTITGQTSWANLSNITKVDPIHTEAYMINNGPLTDIVIRRNIVIRDDGLGGSQGYKLSSRTGQIDDVVFENNIIWAAKPIIGRKQATFNILRMNNNTIFAYGMDFDNANPGVSGWGNGFDGDGTWTVAEMNNNIIASVNIAKFNVTGTNGKNIEIGDVVDWTTGVFVDWQNGNFSPLMSSPACNGSVNPWGVAVGALECVNYTEPAPSEINWTKYSGNPVLPSGPAGAWNDFKSDPFVVKDNSIYKMWYSTNNDGTQTRIAYAESNNGISWTLNPSPVLDLGSPGSWDSGDVETPTIIIDNTAPANERYKMWYSALDDNISRNVYRIGYATSANGTNWSKNGNNPVLGPVPDSPLVYGGVADPVVIKDGSVYKMWYSGITGAGQGEFWINYATSDDGINWSENPNPVLDTSGENSLNCVAIGQPDVIFNGSLYEMWYSCWYNTTLEYWDIEIAYATSDDGIIWNKSENNPVLSKGLAGSWDSFIAGYSSTLIDNGEYKMWYTGAKVDKVGEVIVNIEIGIGLANGSCVEESFALPSSSTRASAGRFERKD